MKLLILAYLIPILLAMKESNNKKEVCNCEPKWVLLRKNACFEAKDEHPAFVPIGSKGWLTQLKLVHVNGILKCYGDSTGSKFGCYSDTNFLNMYITDSKRKVIFPSADQQLFYIAKGYTLPGVNANDNEVIFSKLDYPVPYQTEQQYIEVWHGEDLFDYTEGDNSGKVCIDVYVTFI